MRMMPLEPQQFFLEKFGLTSRDLEGTIGGAMGGLVDYSDLYFEYCIHESVNLEEGLIKKTTRNISQGVGVRALSKEKTGYAYSDEVTVENLKLAAKTAKYIAKEGKNAPQGVAISRLSRVHDLYPVEVPATEVPMEKKNTLLHEIDAFVRQYDPRVTQVMASFVSEHKLIFVVSSEGYMVGDVQPLSRLQVTCIVEEAGNRQVGSFGGGGRTGFSYFLEGDRWKDYANEAAREAILNLSAIDTPAGMMDVVLGPGWPGILLHEAIGHGLEGDFNRKGTSAFANKIGKRVASDLCTVIDDGTIPGRRGSLNTDDEGIPTQRTVLIENGILRGYLQDRLNARLMNMPLTGNGRRESFMHIPMPRMTNTFMLAGESTSEDIIRSVNRGLYAVSFGGGQVDITSGQFVFSTSEAYLIENGKVTRPVKGATLIGNGPEILQRVSMVGNNLELDSGVGTCGKDGQSVPVGVGLPTIKIDGITVGGTKL